MYSCLLGLDKVPGLPFILPPAIQLVTHHDTVAIGFLKQIL